MEFGDKIELGLLPVNALYIHEGKLCTSVSVLGEIHCTQLESWRSDLADLTASVIYVGRGLDLQDIVLGRLHDYT